MRKRTLKIAGVLLAGSMIWSESCFSAPIQSRAEYYRKKAEVIEWKMDHCTNEQSLQRLQKRHARLIAKKRQLSGR